MTHPFLRNEFLQALKTVEQSVDEVFEPERSAVRAKVNKIFAATKDDAPLYDRMHSSVSLQSEECWRLLDHLIAGPGIFAFFELEDDPSMFLLNPPVSASQVAGETTGFQIYFVDSEFTSLVALTSFDVLIASGEAGLRLSALMKSSA